MLLPIKTFANKLKIKKRASEAVSKRKQSGNCNCRRLLESYTSNAGPDRKARMC